jgi:hypothetical protein
VTFFCSTRLFTEAEVVRTHGERILRRLVGRLRGKEDGQSDVLIESTVCGFGLVDELVDFDDEVVVEVAAEDRAEGREDGRVGELLPIEEEAATERLFHHPAKAEVAERRVGVLELPSSDVRVRAGEIDLFDVGLEGVVAAARGRRSAGFGVHPNLLEETTATLVLWVPEEQ